jgi:hypothetical protein
MITPLLVNPYHPQPEEIGVCEPTAPGYVGTYDPPAPYLTRQPQWATSPALELVARKWLDAQGLLVTDLQRFWSHIHASAQRLRDQFSSQHPYDLRAERVTQESGDDMQYWQELALSEVIAQPGGSTAKS